MKIKFSLLLILILLLPSIAITAFAFSSPNIKSSLPVSYSAPLGTESNPYLINSIDEYNSLVNLYKDSTNVFLKLNTDLTETTANTITRYSFNGNLDGNNKTISYLNIPLFSQLGGKVSNLKFTLNTQTCSEASFGALCNELNGTITNCTNNSNLTLSLSTSTTCFGGFTGRNSSSASIINCVNNANITLTVPNGIRVGGFLGEANNPIEITNSTNNGKITITSTEKSTSSVSVYAGGFVGYACYKSSTSSSTTYRFEKLCNTNDVSINAVSTLTYCRIGGILGGATNNTITSINQCASSGILSANNQTTNSNYGNQIGGLIGYIHGAENNFAKINIDNSFTTSPIISTTTSKGLSTLGGLIGHAYTKGLTNNSYIGYSVTVNINNSYSNSSITTTENATNSSTIIGGLIGQSAKTTITNSFSSVTVYSQSQSNKKLGGLIGCYYNYSSSPTNPTITNCISNTRLSYKNIAANYVGGIIGYVDGSITGLNSSITNTTYLTSTYDTIYISNYCVYAIGNSSSLLLSFGNAQENSNITNQNSEFFTTWDFSNIWTFSNDFPMLKFLV